jgi:hypothetical protein
MRYVKNEADLTADDGFQFGDLDEKNTVGGFC